jgi:hypothetical protein
MQTTTIKYQWHLNGIGSSFTMEPCTMPAARDIRVNLPAG